MSARVGRKVQTLRKKKVSKKSIVKKLDALWRAKILERDKVCQYPGCLKRNLQAAHVFSRRIRSVRWNLDNGVGFCAYHHLRWAHVHWEAFRDLVLQKIGQDRFDALKEKAYQFKGKVDLEQIERDLE